MSPRTPESRIWRTTSNQPAFGGESGDLGGLVRVERERFLHEGVLAAFQGETGAGEVGGVLGGDVHHVDVRRGGQLLVRAARARDAVAVGEVLGAGGVAGGDGREALPGVALDGAHEALGDPAGSQDAPAQGGASIGSGVRGVGRAPGKAGIVAQTSGTWTGTVLPPSFMDAMTASATAVATRPSYAVASGEGSPWATASVQACS